MKGINALAKNTRGKKELDQLQRIKYENDKICKENNKLSRENEKMRKEVANLRKQLMHLDLNRHSWATEIIQEHLYEQAIEEPQELMESLKRTWACHSCKNGYLEIVVFSKLGQDHYYRACSECPHRTKSQPYTSDISGIIKDLTILEPKLGKKFKK